MALARAALESMIARMAADPHRRMPRSPSCAVRRRDGVSRPRPATPRRLIVLNEAFHDAIHAASGCRYLQRILVGQRVYDHATRNFILADAEERGRALVEHNAIFEALARRDAGCG